ncbi:MAG TPA: hypothetical protein VF771_02205 [Longimicrobiaceae bacterium]
MLNLTLERIERQIRKLPVEHAYALDATYSILWHTTDDQANQVVFSPTQLESLDCTILTHNHPGGRSLSRPDVMLARRWNLAEIRAVTATHRYSVKPPLAGWNMSDEFQEVLNRERDLLNRQIDKEIESGLLTGWMAERTFHHRLWERMASRGMIRYTAERW